MVSVSTPTKSSSPAKTSGGSQRFSAHTPTRKSGPKSTGNVSKSRSGLVITTTTTTTTTTTVRAPFRSRRSPVIIPDSSDDENPDSPVASDDGRGRSASPVELSIPPSSVSSVAESESESEEDDPDMAAFYAAQYPSHHIPTPAELNAARFESKKNYAVTSGTHVGIFRSWAEAGPCVTGVSDNVHQKFRTWKEAYDLYEETYLAGKVKIVDAGGDISNAPPKFASLLMAMCAELTNQ
ncbi:hypothetical protein V5O48_009412 [Marasmius crinis-equi]|uniref:Ribonuclease H1 N-terminal domain-containing protein n=1 Tax=Marasmius crinis-equi TaxID=585013 RepID=A0ABR3FB73_9AGAR